MTETLAHGQSSEVTLRKLSIEYQHDRDKMVFNNLCVLVLWTKVFSAMEWLLSPKRAGICLEACEEVTSDLVLFNGTTQFHTTLFLFLKYFAKTCFCQKDITLAATCKLFFENLDTWIGFAFFALPISATILYIGYIPVFPNLSDSLKSPH